jgi:tRNA(fMet)-specific endonuclease VapC
MKTTAISVTEAARNFADCINRVRYQNMSFVLLKNGTPVARLVPEKEKVSLGRDLAKVLRGVDLPTDEAITVAELWHGVERASGKHRGRRERYLRTILEELPTIPYTETTALEHARIWAALESSGQMIGDYDLIVAATAIERGSTVATFNQRHFSQVPGLKVIVPA